MSTNANAHTLNGEGGSDKPVIELYIKASSINRDDNGPCPISQQWFMVFYQLAQKQYINLYVNTVNPDVPPEAYQAMDVGRRLPVARVASGFDRQGNDLSGRVYDTNDEIEQLMDIWKCASLALPRDSADEAAAERAVCDLYKNFSLMLKADSKAPLVNSLRKIDGFLGSRPGRYLLSDELTYADCQLMPRLHHLRMAGEFYSSFAIPEDLRHLQAYLQAMYACEAFRGSCPADRDVLQLYYDKLPREAVAGVKFLPTLMDARRAMLGEGASE